MDLNSKRLMLVVPGDLPVSSRRVVSSEEEAWKSYLESPLTAATKAMISVNGDEGSAAALGMLYDYYKVPREKRPSSSVVKLSDSFPSEPVNCASLRTSNHSPQGLGLMPVNLCLNNSSTTEYQGSRVDASSLTGVTRGGGAKGGGGAAVAVVKSEEQTFMRVSCSGYSYQEEPIMLVCEQSRSNLPLVAHFHDDQRGSPDSLDQVALEGEKTGSFSGVDVLRYSPQNTRFQYFLEASFSQRLRQGNGPMAYLNRGQFYALALSRAPCALSSHQPRRLGSGLSLSQGPDGSQSSSEQCIMGGAELQQNSVVQSVIMVVFGKDKCRDEQLNNWKYWHSRQHTAKQRVLDIADYKDSCSTIGNVEEVAYNAVSFTWDVNEEAKVLISVNCLSTDFSSQKGVKGMPLTIQIDTYSYSSSSSSRPIHRAFTQIKVFCDKGAERKLRDEEKKQLRKRNGSSGPSAPIKKAENTLLKTVTDLDSQPVLFIPDAHFGNLQRAGQVFAFNTGEISRDGIVHVKRMFHPAERKICPPLPKKPKVEVERKVLLYVRKESDDVFDALMLHAPTLRALMGAISEKYALPADKINKVYQKSKNGVLVNVDDNLVQHYSNEDTFTLSIKSSADFSHITLSEI